jgi:hypothetical protein
VDRVRSFLVKILPYRFVDWYRRKRALRRFMRGLSIETLERERRLEPLEGRIAASTRGFYHQIVADVLERTDIILQELDRRIEGVAARAEERMTSTETELKELREEVLRLRQQLTRPFEAAEPEEARSRAVAE